MYFQLIFYYEFNFLWINCKYERVERDCCFGVVEIFHIGLLGETHDFVMK